MFFNVDDFYYELMDGWLILLKFRGIFDRIKLKFYSKKYDEDLLNTLSSEGYT